MTDTMKSIIANQIEKSLDNITDETITNLTKMQKVLDDHIRKTKGLKAGKEETLKKIVAMQVEMSEAYNESKRFKFWSDKQADRKKLIHEYADVLHFFLSLCIDLKIRPDSSIMDPHDGYNIRIADNRPDQIYMRAIQSTTITYEMVGMIHKEEVEEEQTMTRYGLDQFIAYYNKLLRYDGYTYRDLIKAYLEKNRINHERQEEGY